MAAALASLVRPDTTRVALTTAPRLPACSASPRPNGPCPVCPRLAVEFEPWRQASYWKAIHDRALQREALLRQENEQLRAQLRQREQQLFGRKTATTATAPPTGRATPRRRGQQPGWPGPHRRDHSHLPAVGRGKTRRRGSHQKPSRIAGSRRVPAQAAGGVRTSPTERTMGRFTECLRCLGR